MSFGAGMTTGIGAGMAIGMSSGTKQARTKMSQYFESEGITLQDEFSEQVDMEYAFDQALSCQCGGRKYLGVVVECGLLAAGAGLAIYFAIAGG